MKIYLVKSRYETVGVFKDSANAIAYADSLEPVKDEDGLGIEVSVKILNVETDF